MPPKKRKYLVLASSMKHTLRFDHPVGWSNLPGSLLTEDIHDGHSSMKDIPLDVQTAIFAELVHTTDVSELSRTLFILRSLSRDVKSFIDGKRSLWQRLGTNFTLKQLDHAIALILHPSALPQWHLFFRHSDYQTTQWNRLMGLAHGAFSLTISSEPIPLVARFINDLSLVPIAPSPLRRLILTGFRVSNERLFELLSSHNTLEVLHIVLQHIHPQFAMTCTLPHLTDLHIGGHPDDIYTLGKLLAHPALIHLTLEPRGKPNTVIMPNLTQLNQVPHVSIKGNMPWVAVNRYLSACSMVVSIDLVFLQEHDAHSILTDLTLRRHRPELPQHLQHISIGPFRDVTALEYLLPFIASANPELRTLTLCVEAPQPSSLVQGFAFDLVATRYTCPKPLTSSDNLYDMGGEGVKCRAMNRWANDSNWGGADDEVDHDAYLWDH